MEYTKNDTENKKDSAAKNIEIGVSMGTKDADKQKEQEEHGDAKKKSDQTE